MRASSLTSSILVSVQTIKIVMKKKRKKKKQIWFSWETMWWQIRISSDITSCCSLLRSIYKSSHHTVTHSFNSNEDEKRKCWWKHFTLLRTDSGEVGLSKNIYWIRVLISLKEKLLLSRGWQLQSLIESNMSHICNAWKRCPTDLLSHGVVPLWITSIFEIHDTIQDTEELLCHQHQ